MEHIEIPTTVILEAMMKKLNLPCPEYKSKYFSEDRFMSELMFYPSIHFLRSSTHPHSLMSYPVDSLKAAMNDAALQAIKYMEAVEKKMPKDFRHVELERDKKMTRVLDRKLEREHQKFVRKANQLVEVAAACDNFINQVHDTTHRIQEIVSGHVSSGYAAVDEKHSANLLAIQNVATGLNQHAIETARLIRATGAFLDEDDNGIGESSGYHGSDSDSNRVQRACEANNYDSDGRPTDYDM